MRKVYKNTEKVWNMVSLAARNSMDEYYTADEEIIIIDDFRADSMQFNTSYYHYQDPITAHQHQQDI